MLTIEYREDSLIVEGRLTNLEGDFSEIEKGSGDMKVQQQEYETLLTNWMISYGEYKEKELLKDYAQWGTIVLLAVYVLSDMWKDNQAN